MSSCGAQRLLKYPCAPAAKTREGKGSVSCTVRAIIFSLTLRLRKRPMASKPPIPGMLMSMIMISGLKSFTN